MGLKAGFRSFLLLLVLLQVLHAYPRSMRSHGSKQDQEVQSVKKALLRLYNGMEIRKNGMVSGPHKGSRRDTPVNGVVENPAEGSERDDFTRRLLKHACNADGGYKRLCVLLSQLVSGAADEKRKTAVVKVDDEQTEKDAERTPDARGLKLSNDKHIFDRSNDQDPDPNSALAHQLMTEQVDIHGKKLKPSGLHTDKTDKAVGDRHDKHPTITPPTEIDEMKLSSQQRRTVTKRNFLKDNNILWPKGIVPYEVDSAFSADDTAVIEAAINQMASLTCVKFKKRSEVNSGLLGHTTYLRFIRGSGCWSYVGRVFSEKQNISLGSGCVNTVTALHEMCHAIGQEHEQSRNDRDKYIQMIWSNINGGQDNNNMAKADTRDVNTYDYESILQYYLKAAAKDYSKYTMRFHDRQLEFLADSATGLTFYDIKDINAAYKCTDQCGSSLPTCQNSGYIYTTCSCLCPVGFTGADCSGIQTDSGCGGVVDVTSGPKTITSPNYPSNYNTGSSCAWLVKGSIGAVIKLTITELKLTYTDWNSRCEHWLEMRYNLLGQTGLKKCGDTSNEIYKTTWDGNPNLLYLKFDSMASAETTTGFSLTVESTPPGCASSPCFQGTCEDDPTTVYKCVCDKNYDGVHCDQVKASASFSCTFESPDICVFANVAIGDDIDWTRHQGTTRSSGTGPDGAHGGLYYMYTEVSFQQQGDKARLVSSYALTAQNWCLTFWYHMYGSGMGKFAVFGEVDTTEIWSKSADLGTDWLKAEMTILLNSKQKIVLEAIVGSFFEGDIAIDDLALRSGTCQQLPCSTSPCKNGGVCSNSGSTFTCACTSGWTGSTCETASQQLPCSTSPCKNGGVCSNSGSTFTCACTSGWTGSTCETASQQLPCSISPCKNGGVCSNSGSTFTCACTSGWTGSTCETASLPCDASPCKNGGTCTNSGLTFICACTSIWSGPTCEMQVIPCDASPCKNGGTCTNSGSTFFCACTSTWSGPTCEMQALPCDASPCKNGGTCTDSGSTFICACTTSTWSGATCEAQVLPCDASPCKNGGSCTNSGSTFICGCTSTWSGPTCEMQVLPCDASPCKNGGTCTNSGSTFICACTSTWSGPTCETQVLPCDASPCKNGGTCTNSGSTFICACTTSTWSGATCETQVLPCDAFPCKNGGICTNSGSTFSCACTSTWSGATCDAQVLPCGTSPCKHGGTCTNSGSTFSCACTSTWSGPTCATPVTGQPCDTVPCKNGGTCTISGSTFSCACASTWTGVTCETQVQHCDSSTCKNGGTCTNSGSTLSCACPSTWTGATCETQVQHCDSSTCKNGGTCTNSGSTFSCTCPSTWTGATCETQVLPCDLSPCMNDGTCITSGSTFSCTCTSTWTGATCETQVLPCDSSPCQNGGTCINSGSTFRCACTSTWTGVTCDASVNAVVTCSFEDGETDDLFVGYKYADFDWTLNSGCTESPGTGPCSASDGVKYMYIEVNDTQDDTYASLVSNFNLGDGNKCLTFDYHMYGHPNYLSVWTIDPGHSWIRLWYRYGNQGNVWHKASINITATSSTTVSIDAGKGSGTTSWQGDIAIDFIKISPSPCSSPPCSSNPCQNGGICSNTASGSHKYTCSCFNGYTGDNCQTAPVLPCDSSPCANDGSCINSGSTFRCACTSTWTGATCEQTVNAVVTCSFEDGETDDLFVNYKYADFDWTLNSGCTESPGTGPCSASDGAKYMYIEVNDTQDDTYASLVSNFNLGDGNKCLTFDYHMYGHPNYLSVWTIDPGHSWIRLWYRYGNQGNVWHKASINIIATASTTLSIDAGKGSRTTSWQGDIAIDFIKISPSPCPPPPCSSNPCQYGGICSNTPSGSNQYTCRCLTGYTGDNCQTAPVSDPCIPNPCQNGGACSNTPSVSNQYTCSCGNGYTGNNCQTAQAGAALTCSFEDGETCKLFVNIQGDYFDWTRNSGCTESPGTGPCSASDGVTYMYIEVNDTEDGSYASLESDFNLGDGDKCLTFGYHMYGNPSYLSVWTKEEGGSWTHLWFEYGDQGNQWHKASINITTTALTTLSIDAEKGFGDNSWQGDIAIDLVQISPSPCS